MAHRYADLARENVKLKHQLDQVHAQLHDYAEQLQAAQAQLADWRELLLDNDLIEPTPREALWSLVSRYDFPPIGLPGGRWVGGCEEAWSEALCHGLSDAEVEHALALSDEGGLALGGALADLLAAPDPRCEAHRGEQEGWWDAAWRQEVGT